MKKLLLLIVWLVCTPGFADTASIPDIARADGLLAILDQRLRISEQVARAKWNSRSPVEDPAREEQVLDSFAKQAAAAGLDADWARVVMRAQIEASKVRQRELMAVWKARHVPPFAKVPDLARDIRPELDRLAIELVASLGQVRPLLQSDPGLLAWRTRVLWGNAPDPARRKAVEPFLR